MSRPALKIQCGYGFTTTGGGGRECVNMPDPQNIPFSVIPSVAQFVIFCPHEGLVSEHPTGKEASRALVTKLKTDSEAAIYVREQDCWRLF
jgi:hypothetical protein